MTANTAPRSRDGGAIKEPLDSNKPKDNEQGMGIRMRTASRTDSNRCAYFETDFCLRKYFVCWGYLIQLTETIIEIR